MRSVSRDTIIKTFACFLYTSIYVTDNIFALFHPKNDSWSFACTQAKYLFCPIMKTCTSNLWCCTYIKFVMVSQRHLHLICDVQTSLCAAMIPLSQDTRHSHHACLYLIQLEALTQYVVQCDCMNTRYCTFSDVNAKHLSIILICRGRFCIGIPLYRTRHMFAIAFGCFCKT